MLLILVAHSFIGVVDLLVRVIAKMDDVSDLNIFRHVANIYYFCDKSKRKFFCN